MSRLVSPSGIIRSSTESQCSSAPEPLGRAACVFRGGAVELEEKRASGAMEGEQKALGETRARISKEIVRLQSEYYGKGPTRAKTYIVDDLVATIG